MELAWTYVFRTSTVSNLVDLPPGGSSFPTTPTSSTATATNTATNTATTTPTPTTCRLFSKCFFSWWRLFG